MPPSPRRQLAATIAAFLAAGTLDAVLTPAWGSAPLMGAVTGLVLALRLLGGRGGWLVGLAVLATGLRPGLWGAPGALLGAGAIAAAGAAGALVAAGWIGRRSADPFLERPALALRHLALAMAAPVAAGLTAGGLALAQGGAWTAAGMALASSALGDALGVTVVAPALLATALHGRAALERAKQHGGELAIALALTAGCLWLGFGQGLFVQPALTLVVVWASFRARPAGGLLLMGALAGVIVALTAAGLGRQGGGVALAAMLAQLRMLAQATPLLFLHGVLAANDQHLAHLEREVALRTEDLLLATQQAEASSAAKSEFLANMSHELRTPLTALLGFGQMLGEARLPEGDRRRYAGIVERNGAYLLALIDDLLDLARFEAGAPAPRLADVALAELAQDLEIALGPAARDRGLAFKVQCEAGLPPVVRTDPVRLRQALLKLVDNAVKFTAEGEVKIHLAFADGQLSIAVSDTGPGIAPADAERIFQPFAQADGSSTRRHGGAGVGLAICQAAAKALGGSLALDSALGRGSTFRLSVPVEVPQAPVPAASATPAQAVRVLLAEDGVDNRLLLVALLRRLGAEPDVAEDGRVALARARAAKAAGRPYPLILMDIQMPELDGYSATRALREEGWTGRIVALTASGLAEERERCLASGFDRYLTKPVAAEALRDALAFAGAEPLRSSLAGDPDLDDIIHAFVGNLGQRAGAMRDAFAGGDHDALRRLAHQLKGAAGGYGFEAITHAAGRLEHAPLDGMPAALAELEALCARARSPLEAP